MKKFLIIILSFMLSVLLCVGCVTFTPPDNTGNPGDKPKPGTPGNDPDPERLFTVTLMCENQPFAPPVSMFAQWTNDNEVYDAEFNDDGVAQVKGLDGDYHVTLSTIPEGYTYDPNGYIVDNNNTDVIIEMLPIIPTVGIGAEPYKAIPVSKLGTYRTTLNSANHIVYYEYEPTANGWYYIESWVDLTANDINPLVDVYNGTKQFKHFVRTQDSGGISSTYAKNFRMELELTDDMLGNVWTFGIHADTRSGGYPITVDFTIKRMGDPQTGELSYEMLEAKGPFMKYGDGNFRYTYEDTNRILDASRFKLNPDDGFYHLYDKETGEYGATLVVMLDKDNEVMGPTDDKTGFMFILVSKKVYDPLYGKNVDYTDVIATYSKYTVNGWHPVTEELKHFMQLYASRENLFRDGEGIAEIDREAYEGVPPFKGLKSLEDDQWLFACGY